MALILTRTRSIMVLSCILFSMMAPMSQLESGAADYIRCETKETPNYTCWIAWNSNGQWIATWNKQISGIDIWNATTKERSIRLEAHADVVVWYPLPDKSNLLALVTEYQIEVWDVETGKRTQVYNLEEILFGELDKGNLENLPEGFTSIAWNTGSNEIAIVADYWLGIWNLETDEFRTLGFGYDAKKALPALAVAWSGDGQYLVLARNTIQIYERDTLTLYKEFSSSKVYFMNAYRGLQSLSWSPDGRFLATDAIPIEDTTKAFIRIYDVATDEMTLIESHSSPINAVAWSLDGKFIASAGGNDFLGLPSDNAIRIWDTETYDLLKEIKFETSITSISWKPDGTQLAAVDSKGVVYILDIEQP